LPQALFAIRTAVSKSIGLAPDQLLFGRDASQPINIAFGKPPMPPQGHLDYHRCADQLRNRIDNAQKYAQEKIVLAITRQRRNYQQDAKEINVGGKVWLFTPVTKPGQSPKLAEFWSGPWIITHKVDNICYIVTAPEMESTAPPQTVPVDRLCLYRMLAAPGILLPQTESRAAKQAKDDDDDDFMEYIPIVPHQQQQLVPHQPPPPGATARAAASRATATKAAASTAAGTTATAKAAIAATKPTGISTRGTNFQGTFTATG
jgi:hypothetical protein